MLGALVFSNISAYSHSLTLSLRIYLWVNHAIHFIIKWETLFLFRVEVTIYMTRIYSLLYIQDEFFLLSHGVMSLNVQPRIRPMPFMRGGRFFPIKVNNFSYIILCSHINS